MTKFPWLAHGQPTPLPTNLSAFLCRLRSIATNMDHFVRRLSIRMSVRLSVRPSVRPSIYPSVTLLCHTFQSYVSQATHAFLGMLPLFLYLEIVDFQLSCPLFPYMELVGSLICMAKFPWEAHSAAQV